MMNNIEEQIAKLFQSLPRQSLNWDKERVWLKVQNHMRSARIPRPDLTTQNGFWIGFRFGKIARAAVILIVVISLVGVAKASRGSIPGETLYSVKKAVEKVEVALATSDQNKIEILATHAKTRLAEVKILVQEKHKSAIVAQTLNDLKATTKEVVAVSTANPSLADHAVKLSTEEEQVLVSVQGQIEGEAKQVAEQVIADSRDTILKLTSEDKIKGATTSLNKSEETPTSTPAAPPATRPAPPKIKDGPVESQIQIDDVVKGQSESADVTQDPEVLSQPTLSF